MTGMLHTEASGSRNRQCFFPSSRMCRNYWVTGPELQVYFSSFQQCSPGQLAFFFLGSCLNEIDLCHFSHSVQYEKTKNCQQKMCNTKDKEPNPIQHRSRDTKCPPLPRNAHPLATLLIPLYCSVPLSANGQGSCSSISEAAQASLLALLTHWVAQMCLMAHLRPPPLALRLQRQQ